MVSVEKALQILEVSIEPGGSKTLSLADAVGCILAEAIFSPLNMPMFRQSAMDGYALRYNENANSYALIDEIAAGSSNNPALRGGECVRIFTGALVPDDADVVVQQEWVEIKDNHIFINQKIEKGRNIRPIGEQIKTGDLALEKGAILNPAAIGFLAGLGIGEVAVIQSPSIAVLTTGNELVELGVSLKMGQVYESNSGMLSAALTQLQFKNQILATVTDDYELTVETIKNALQKFDFLILTGGISVGDYDFVGKALHQLGVQELVYKINQKPGKPVYIGKLGNKYVTALPGNPAAALTCFYIYVLPMLNKLMGKPFAGLETINAPFAADYEKKGDRAEFLKAQLNQGEFHILGGQSSAMLRSFAVADALVYIPSNKSLVKAGEQMIGFKLPK